MQKRAVQDHYFFLFPTIPLANVQTAASTGTIMVLELLAGVKAF
jgi:hypothetical protein